MKHTVPLLAAVVACSLLSAVAQDPQPQLTSRTTQPAQPQAKPAQPVEITVPAGTKVPLTLKQGITTKNAKEGDPVYAQTSFPVTANDRMIIPAGTFVQGVVRRVQRPGHVKGRAQLQMSFTSMIFPNGYTVMLPGTVDSTPGSDTMNVKGKEGTIEGQGNKAKDAATIARDAAAGAGIGAIAGSSSGSTGKGAAAGAAGGGVIGLATVLFSRGPEIQLAPGDSIEMIIERSLILDDGKLTKQVQSN
jgi:hypothetical protein